MYSDVDESVGYMWDIFLYLYFVYGLRGSLLCLWMFCSDWVCGVWMKKKKKSKVIVQINDTQTLSRFAAHSFSFSFHSCIITNVTLELISDKHVWALFVVVVFVARWWNSSWTFVHFLIFGRSTLLHDCRSRLCSICVWTLLFLKENKSVFDSDFH